MDITTHNRLEFTLNLGENLYSLKMPSGVQVTEAIEACGYFLSGLTKMKKEKEAALKKERKDKDKLIGEALEKEAPLGGPLLGKNV